MTTITPDQISFIVTVVYGFNVRIFKRDLWISLRQQYATQGRDPWLIMDDFNVILDSQGKKGHKKIDKYGVQEFQDWIRDVDVLHIPSRGFEFFWSNKREVNCRTYTKIDHMFCNEEWNQKLPNYQLDYEAPVLSDHSQGVLSVKLNQNMEPKPFKILKGWMNHQQFKPTLEENWNILIQATPKYV